jgi:hypothetical protein
MKNLLWALSIIFVEARKANETVIHALNYHKSRNKIKVTGWVLCTHCDPAQLKP